MTEIRELLDYYKKLVDKDYKRSTKTLRLLKQADVEHGFLESNHPVDPSLSRFYRKKLNGTVLKTNNPDSSLAFAGFKSGNKNLSMEDLKAIFPEANRVTKKDLENFNKNGHLIYISNDASRGTVLHEMGHIKSRKEFGGSMAKGKGELLEGIDTVAEENMASANALHALRNQKGVEKDKEILDKALSTYTLGLRDKLKR